jgi:mannose-1-phosphate guanylyltransferase
MKAMILAAGRGRRLRPLTDALPKVLVPIVNSPMLERTIELLSLHGVQEVIINAHHQSHRIADYLKKRDPSGVRIEIRVEKEILGTGGGIKNTQDFWDERPFIAINGDILTDINLTDVYTYHQRRANLVTMVLHDVPRYNKLRIDRDMNILSISPTPGGGNTLAFTGIHVIEPEVLDYIPEDARYNIIDCYRQLIQEKRAVRAYVATGHRWIDIGTVHEYLRANFDLLAPEKVAVGPDCHINAEASLNGLAVLGSRCSIERGAMVQGSVLWDEVTVRAGVRVVDSVVTTGIIVEEDIAGGVAIR